MEIQIVGASIDIQEELSVFLITIKSSEPINILECDVAIADIENMDEFMETGDSNITFHYYNVENLENEQSKRHLIYFDADPSINIKSYLAVAIEKIIIKNSEEKKQEIEYSENELDWTPALIIEDLELENAFLEVNGFNPETKEYKEAYIGLALYNYTDMKLQSFSFEVISEKDGVSYFGVPIEDCSIGDEDPDEIYCSVGIHNDIDLNQEFYISICDYIFDDWEEVIITDEDRNWIPLEVEFESVK